MGLINSRSDLKSRRRKLRQDQTSEEEVLWFHLRNRKLGYKFRRQHSYSSCILDFYCLEFKLNIELDRAHHFTVEGKEEDVKIDAFLQNQGITVLRIENKHIRENLSVVLKLIEDTCKEIDA